MDLAFKKLDQISNQHYRAVAVEVYGSNPVFSSNILFDLTTIHFQFDKPFPITRNSGL